MQSICVLIVEMEFEQLNTCYTDADAQVSSITTKRERELYIIFKNLHPSSSLMKMLYKFFLIFINLVALQ